MPTACAFLLSACLWPRTFLFSFSPPVFCFFPSLLFTIILYLYNSYLSRFQSNYFLTSASLTVSRLPAYIIIFILFIYWHLQKLYKVAHTYSVKASRLLCLNAFLIKNKNSENPYVARLSSVLFFSKMPFFLFAYYLYIFIYIQEKACFLYRQEKMSFRENPVYAFKYRV